MLLATNVLENTDHEFVDHFNTLCICTSDTRTTCDDSVWSNFCQHENLFTIWLKSSDNIFDKPFLFHRFENHIQLSITHCVCLNTWILRKYFLSKFSNRAPHIICLLKYLINNLLMIIHLISTLGILRSHIVINTISGSCILLHLNSIIPEKLIKSRNNFCLLEGRSSNVILFTFCL